MKLKGFLNRCCKNSPSADLEFYDGNNNPMAVDGKIQKMIEHSFTEKFPHIFLFNGSDSATVWNEINDALTGNENYNNTKIYGRPVSPLFCKSDELTKWLKFIQADEARVQAVESAKQARFGTVKMLLANTEMTEEEILKNVIGVTQDELINARSSVV